MCGWKIGYNNIVVEVYDEFVKGRARTKLLAAVLSVQSDVEMLSIRTMEEYAKKNHISGEEAGEIFHQNHIFEKSMENRKEGPTYTFYDGPPTANGKPHIGHVLTRVIKDMIPRYRAMKGYMVPRKAGWDTHGLPVELEVEKKLGLDGKEQIEEYGMEPFIQQCKESVWKYKGMWEDFSSTVGFWADMEHPYVTYEDNYIESEWWALKEIWNKGLLYKGFKIVPYCPRCGTPLSSQEVSQGYKLVKERSAIARFKVVGEDAYFLAWTTTPWRSEERRVGKECRSRWSPYH